MATHDAPLHPDLPFSERELARAFRLVTPPRKAARLARIMANVVGTAAALEGSTAGSPVIRARTDGTSRFGAPSLDISPSVFALLALAHPALAARVAALQEARADRVVAVSRADRPGAVRAGFLAHWQATLERAADAVAARERRRRERRRARRRR